MKLRIPIWVRFTKKCPLRGIVPHADKMDGTTYKIALLIHFDKWGHKLKELEDWASKEEDKRRYFRAVWAVVPHIMKYGLNSNIYQNPKERKEFLRYVKHCLDKYSDTLEGDILYRCKVCTWLYNPPGFGTDNVHLPNHDAGSKLPAGRSYYRDVARMKQKQIKGK